MANGIQRSRRRLVAVAALSCVAASCGLVALPAAGAADPSPDAGALLDIAAVVVSPVGGLSAHEGQTVPWTVALSSAPTAPVTVELAVTAGARPITGSVTFTPDDWAAPRAVAVTLDQDQVDDEGARAIVHHELSSDDHRYDGLMVPDQVVSVVDDDTAAVLVTRGDDAAIELDEASATSGSYELVLASRPVEPVTVDVAALAGQALVRPSSVTFLPDAWNVPQRVDVQGIDDDVVEAVRHPDTLVHVANSADPAYSALRIDDLLVAIADDDHAGIVLRHTLPSTRVTEDGLGDTVTVALATRPTAPVTLVFPAIHVQVAGGAPLTIEPEVWDTPHRLDVRPIDDVSHEHSPHAGTIGAFAMSEDAAYEGVSAVPLTVEVVDDGDAAAGHADDAATGGHADDAPRDGAADPHAVDHGPAPSVAFAIPLLSSERAADLAHRHPDEHEPAPGDARPTSEPGVESGAAPDAISRVDPPSGDARIVVDVGGDEVRLDERDPGGSSRHVTFVLSAEPTGPVQVVPTFADGQTTFLEGPVRFGRDDWDEPQRRTWRAYDDQRSEAAEHDARVTFSVISDDPRYAASTVPPLVAVLGDDGDRGQLPGADPWAGGGVSGDTRDVDGKDGLGATGEAGQQLPGEDDGDRDGAGGERAGDGDGADAGSGGDAPRDGDGQAGAGAAEPGAPDVDRGESTRAEDGGSTAPDEDVRVQAADRSGSDERGGVLERLGHSWPLVATLALIGAMLVGTGMFLLRDPVSAAQRHTGVRPRTGRGEERTPRRSIASRARAVLRRSRR